MLILGMALFVGILGFGMFLLHWGWNTIAIETNHLNWIISYKVTAAIMVLLSFIKGIFSVTVNKQDPSTNPDLLKELL